MSKNLAAWLTYLETFPSGLLHPDLDRTAKIAARLDIQQFSCPVITVAGTNGKGSCVVLLEAMLLAAGFRVGAYISPHVLTYNERIRIMGENIDDLSLITAFELIAANRAEQTLSFFEFSTLAALAIFKQQNLDVLILEVGLGGTNDPVNIVASDIALISTIDLDHTQILGMDREAIAREKAGIMRAGKPVVCGDLDPPANIYSEAQKRQAQLYTLNKDFNYCGTNDTWTWSCGNTVMSNLPLPRLPLQNAATALMAIHLLQAKLHVTPDAISAGLTRAFLLGRYQKIQWQHKEIILDVAHNPEAARLLAANLQREKVNGKLLALTSMLQDKDIPATLQPLADLVDIWYVAKLTSQRAATLEQLAASLQAIHARAIRTFNSIATAWQQVIAECKEKDKILIFGSFYTVASVLKMLSG